MFLTSRPRLILIRGLPGSGKSTLARQKSLQLWLVHLETDMYFTDEKGVYVYRSEDLLSAHTWVFETARRLLVSGQGVVVSVVAEKREHVEPYRALWHRLSCDFELITLKTQHGSLHDVPESVIERMRREWEDIHDERIVESV